MIRRGGNGHARLEEVARHAGVAPITVSRALRTPDKVSRVTLARIHEAIQATGYVPNLLAGGLASNRTSLMAAIVPNIANPTFARTIQGLSDVLRRRGLHLMVGSSAHSMAKEEELVRAFLGQRPCGFFLHETVHSAAAQQLLTRAGVPIVEAGTLVREPIDVVVSYSNFAAAKALTLHLGARGYRRIAFVSSPISARSSHRRRGYGAALKSLGMQREPSLMAEAVSDFASGARAVVALLDRDPGIDSVLFTGNAAAIGALLECQRRGWAVPSRVAIAGLDDNDLACQMIPALTGVRVPRYEIGKRAAEVLLERLDGRAVTPSRIDLGFELIKRDST